MTEQANLFCWSNQGLFSNNYIEFRLRDSSLWKEQYENARTAFEKIKKAYGNIKGLRLGPGQEAELEDKFIRPVLLALGYEYNVQPVTSRGAKKKRPDYALFQGKDSYREAISFKGDPRNFFARALTILEVKYWGRRLNDADKQDILDSRDPTAQTVKYLEDVHFHTNQKLDWAILTNGKHWRLFYYRAASRSGNYYETDLEEIINRNDLDDFLYFYLFFSRDAFITDNVSGQTWLNQHYIGSEKYAKAVSDKLKGLIFDDIFERLAEGIIHFRRNELLILEETEESRKDVFKACLTILYRLLFLLYAESRNLLPVNEHAYKSISLQGLKEDIYKDIRDLGAERMSKKSYVYWARFEGLCNIIAKGDPSINVPFYDGGLFENFDDSFLKKHKMADPYLAEAIEKLAVDHEEKHPPHVIPFIDYSSLSVRHLGDIYEGLLEFHLNIADEDVLEVRENGKSIWKNTSDVGRKGRTYRIKQKGEIYIENSKHERKTSGSYFTPPYIVEYIVDNAVGPIIRERIEIIKELLEELEKLYKKQRRELKKPKTWNHWEYPGVPKGKYSRDIADKEELVFESIFNLKVLDPAMGSGHFLVHAVDFISEIIITFLANYPENPIIRKLHKMKDEIISDVRRQGVRIDENKLTEINLIKRMVMKRNIYGVDLNEMAVELAKVSLWLHCFILGAPLSFLDHHLKCGNSLVGVTVREVREDIEGTGLGDVRSQLGLFGSRFTGLMLATNLMRHVGELSDLTADQVHESRSEYIKASDALSPFKRILDIYTSQWFGNGSDKKKKNNDISSSYAVKFLKSEHAERLINGKILNDAIAELPKHERIVAQTALEAAEKMLFFHWELEFPEVFYGSRMGNTQKVEKLEGAGFDTIIGNPPYDVIVEDNYYKRSIARGTGNLFGHFIARGSSLLKNNASFSLVVPLSFSCGSDFENLRRHIFSKFGRLTTSHFSIRPAKLFPNVDQRISIFVASGSSNNGCNVASSRLYRFHDGEQEKLVLNPQFGEVENISQGYIPRVANSVGASIYNKFKKIPTTIGDFISKDDKNSSKWWYHSVGRYWIKAYNYIPLFKREGKKGISSDIKEILSTLKAVSESSIAIINSDLFYFWWITQSDEFHVLGSQISSMPFPESLLSETKTKSLVERLMNDYKKKAIRKTIQVGGKEVTMDEIHARLSRDVILEIDNVLAPHYGLKKEELAFLKDYDIQFRLSEE